MAGLGYRYFPAGHRNRSCYHLAGHGGAKRAVRDVAVQVKSSSFVFRTDVKSYYASIDHEILFAQLKKHVSDPRLLDILWQYMKRTIYDGGLYEDVAVGIPLGCPLSPLMAALYLKPIDDAMAETGLFYARFMDDWVELAPTRWKLRAVIRTVNQILAKLKVDQHPDKTFIGRISRGFDFLGYRFQSDGLIGVARKTIIRFVERATWLYEQGADLDRIGKYVRLWLKWVNSGIDSACISLANAMNLSRPFVSGSSTPRAVCGLLIIRHETSCYDKS
ncbi:reverse transcriptase/maturase family protein [Gimesia aquarii]|uniref:Reverse transcriptase (RNA-dependent DNA polymerase) n=1 Tax=Gimesia aquarii TaxID=2527964 RepID=A0A517WY61_9PLAN|nr:reverse transcriptase/maturase family protein [Gimesia aquarii]QDU10182.1 Reverse transcriptase (RNA-dependent DNA polymerase) [Gimesia aquarii]